MCFERVGILLINIGFLPAREHSRATMAHGRPPARIVCWIFLYTRYSYSYIFVFVLPYFTIVVNEQ